MNEYKDARESFALNIKLSGRSSVENDSLYIKNSLRILAAFLPMTTLLFAQDPLLEQRAEASYILV